MELINQVEFSSGHWIWRGPTLRGWPIIRHSGGKRKVSARLEMAVRYGAWDRNKKIYGTCDEELCVRPDHSGSAREYFDTKMTECRRGHEYTPENTRMTSQGFRQCKRCNRENKREAKYRAGHSLY